MRKFLAFIMPIVMLAALTGAASGCSKKEGTMENLGKQADQAAKDVAGAINK